MPRNWQLTKALPARSASNMLPFPKALQNQQEWILLFASIKSCLDIWMVLRRIFAGLSAAGFHLHGPCKSTKLYANGIGSFLETCQHVGVHYSNFASFIQL